MDDKNKMLAVIIAGAICAICAVMVFPKLVAGIAIGVALSNWDKTEAPIKAGIAKLKRWIAKLKA